MELLKLTDDNYFSKEAHKQYVSVSQFKAFLDCEAAAFAELNGIWEKPQKDVFLVGNYGHSHFENSLDKFKIQHPEIFTKQGTLRAEYKQADEMINALETDEIFKSIFVGESEIIYTAFLYGTWWKIKVDKQNIKEGYFVDLKFIKDFERVWDGSQRKKVTFVEKYGYLIQIAIYRAVICANLNINPEDLEAFIIAVTKQSPPDKMVLRFNPEDYEIGLKVVENNIAHILDVKSGKVPPTRCEKCDYCRATKKLDRAYHYSEL
jgi:hypothetical protein